MNLFTPKDTPFAWKYCDLKVSQEIVAFKTNGKWINVGGTVLVPNFPRSKFPTLTVESMYCTAKQVREVWSDGTTHIVPKERITKKPYDEVIYVIDENFTVVDLEVDNITVSFIGCYGSSTVKPEDVALFNVDIQVVSKKFPEFEVMSLHRLIDELSSMPSAPGWSHFNNPNFEERVPTPPKVKKPTPPPIVTDEEEALTTLADEADAMIDPQELHYLQSIDEAVPGDTYRKQLSKLEKENFHYRKILQLRGVDLKPLKRGLETVKGSEKKKFEEEKLRLKKQEEYEKQISSLRSKMGEYFNPNRNEPVDYVEKPFIQGFSQAERKASLKEVASGLLAAQNEAKKRSKNVIEDMEEE